MCRTCITSTIKSQFDYGTTKEFKCVCGSGTLDEEKLKTFLSEKDYKRLLRFRLSREIDSRDDMIWCPNSNCDKALVRARGQQKGEC